MKPIHRAAAGAALLACGAAAHALTFSFTFTSGTSAQAQQGFIEAGQMWSSIFTDTVTVVMTVGTQTLGSGVLAQAGSRELTFSYPTFSGALTNDATTAADFTAVSNLPLGSTFGVLINRTSDNPNGAGSATPYVDTAGANNANVRITTRRWDLPSAAAASAIAAAPATPASRSTAPSPTTTTAATASRAASSTSSASPPTRSGTRSASSAASTNWTNRSATGLPTRPTPSA